MRAARPPEGSNFAPEAGSEAAEPRAWGEHIGARLAVASAIVGGARDMLRGRTLLAILVIAFGVALGYAVELINRAAVGELTNAIAMLSGKADLEVRGPRAGFDESLYPRLARDPDVAAASPVVEVEAKLAGRDEALPILGVDVFRAVEMNSALVAVARDRFDTLRGDAIFPSAAAARSLDVAAGDAIAVQTGLREVALRVAGRIAASEGTQRYAVMDIAAVQDRFDRAGRVTRIDLRLRPGADAAAAQRRLQPQLPPGVHVAPPETNAEAAARFSRAYRVNLDVLALVALFTGAMLVYATQTLAVVRRRSQFALLRTLGLPRRRLVAWVIAEAGLLGALGAMLGLAAGHALAWLALRHYGADLGAGFFRAGAEAPPLSPWLLAGFACLGIVAAVAGSALPAREAAGAAPAAALKATDTDIEAPAHASRAAALAIAVAIAATFMPPVAELPLFGYLGIALFLIGGILALPKLAQIALRAVPPPKSMAASLALAWLRANPGRFAATLAAVVASVALMVSMAIMVASFRHSLDDWLAIMLPADLYLRTGSDTAYLGADDRRAIAATPGVARAEFMRVTSIELDPRRPRVVLLARDIDPSDASRRLALIGASRTPGRDAPPPAWINEAVADVERLAPGATLTLPLAGRNATFTVAGVWRDYARQQGAIVIERARYRALTGDDTVNEAALWLAPGAHIEDVRSAILQHAGDPTRLQTATPGDLRRLSLATFDRTFAVTYALEAAAVLIGLVGLSAALAAQTLARSREFGVLRHLGMTRRQIGSMLAIEGATFAAIGVVFGSMLGFVVSLVLIHVVNRQSFHWGMDLHVPWLGLSLLAAGLVALATLTARWSARGATSIAAVRAVREDW